MRQEEFIGPVNIGSEEMVTINDLSKMIINVSGKSLGIVHTEGPTGVRGRNSDNDLVREKLNWDYKMTLREGMEKTYDWIKQQIDQSEWIYESPDNGKTIKKRRINV